MLHVDMDAFYASVEARDDARLAGIPLIVGGDGRRGVVASCSYEARVFGVRSAMPSARARLLCPEAVFVSGRHGRYAEVSTELHQIFERFTPLVEGISLDEAFLDVTGAQRLHGPAPVIAASIRDEVRKQLHLECSVGVARVKFLAKLASEAAKPKVVGRRVEAGPGVFVVEAGRELEFLHPLPIEALWGVGPASSARLKRLGISTVGDLAAIPAATAEAALGRAHGEHLYRLAQGIDERTVEPSREVKSVSHEETYATDRRDAQGMHVEVLRMADAVATRLRKAGLAGRTVTLKVRYGDFTTLTRSVTASAPVDSGAEIAVMADRLLSAVDLDPGVRLLGVGVSNLGAAGAGVAEQLALGLDWAAGAASAATASAATASAATAAAAATSAAVDAIRDRFGATAVGPAALLGPAGLRIKKPGDTRWGPPKPDEDKR